MKKIIALLFCVSLISCNDGDFDTPAFDFGETVYVCNEYTIFKLSTAEAMVVSLTKSEIKNKVTTEPISVQISETNVIYRTFDDVITESYFCVDIPPTTPILLSNWTGTPGESNKIFIETVEELNSSNTLIGYRHYITFQNLKLKNGESFIAYEENDFGSFVTPL